MKIMSNVIDESIKVRSRLVSYLLKDVDADGVEQDVAVEFSNGLYREEAIGEAVSFGLHQMIFGERGMTRQPMLMGAITPAFDLTEREWARAWERYEALHHVAGHKYIEVMHSWGGVAHKHRVYSRMSSTGVVAKDVARERKDADLMVSLGVEFKRIG